MKKSPVLIVLLVFGLSFVGVSSAAEPPHLINEETNTWYIYHSADAECGVQVKTIDDTLPPSFVLEIVYPTTLPRPCSLQTPNAKKLKNLKLFKTEKQVLFLPGGWFSYKGSPDEYCYYHPVYKQWQCITF